MIYFILGILSTIVFIVSIIAIIIYKKLKNKKGFFNKFYEVYFYESDFQK